MPQPSWKSLIRWSTAVAVVLSVPAVAFAQTVVGTRHDLSVTLPAGITKYGQVCVYCHTPHRALATTMPLWNHDTTVTAYTMYTAANSATMNMTVGARPGPVSVACLSCHDGTIGLDVISNLPNQTYTPVTNSIRIGAIGLVGSDGRNDHPIAVTYNNVAGAGGDAAFNAIVDGRVGVLPLYGASRNQMECGTCHNVHTNAIPPFLRQTNTNSALCITCHIK